MRIKDFIALVASINYKPNFRVWTERNRIFGGEVHLRVEHRTLDSKNPKRDMIAICGGRRYHVDNIKDMDIKLAKVIIYELIKHMEMHEIDEWLKFDNVNYKDPHPKGGL